jgi:hypothetical protein
MRMWGIEPGYLCKQHLLGEHGELHKHRHNFVKQHSIKGRITPVVQIEPENMQARHDALAEEMLKRGFVHKSPYEQPDLSYLPDEQRYAKVDVREAYDELTARCTDCAMLRRLRELTR